MESLHLFRKFSQVLLISCVSPIIFNISQIEAKWKLTLTAITEKIPVLTGKIPEKVALVIKENYSLLFAFVSFRDYSSFYTHGPT